MRPFRMVIAGVAALVLSATVAVSGASAGPSSNSDGQVHAAVNNGSPAPARSWPWIAAITDRRAPTLADGQFCGGILVDPSWVLTAAHCMVDYANNPGLLAIAIGREDLDSADGQVLSVDRVVLNPGFTPGNHVNDVALIHLISSSSQPTMPLMTADVEPNYNQGGTDGKAAGWGALDPAATNFPHRLQEAFLHVLPDQTCAVFAEFAPGNHLCAGAGAITVCVGDSGGPLLVTDTKGTLRLAGIVNFGPTTCGIAPVAFARVSQQVGWITSVIGTPTAAPNPTPAPTPAPNPTPAPAPPLAPTGQPGYWMLGRDAKVFPFGAAANLGQAAGQIGAAVATALQPTPDDQGYWIVTDAGGVYSFGDAKFFGTLPPGTLVAGETVTTLAATPTGQGYYLFTSAGRVFAFGDAVKRGDMSGKPLNGPVLGAALTPSGNGYYMVGSDGGIFSFGDAVFRGSMGGKPLNAPVRSLVPTADGSGYWLVASDGGIFAFSAPFRGSMGGTLLNRPIVGMVRYGNGYLMVASDGGVFNFSDTPFVGSLGATPPAQPIVGIAAA